MISMPERVHCQLVIKQVTSSSAMAERPHELGDFKGVGHFEAKFWVEGLHFAPIDR